MPPGTSKYDEKDGVPAPGLTRKSKTTPSTYQQTVTQETSLPHQSLPLGKGPRAKKTIKTCREDDGPQKQSPIKKAPVKTRRTCVSAEKESLLLKKATINVPNAVKAAAAANAAAKKRMVRPKLENKTTVMSKDKSYTILELLGSGGFGDVYKVEQSDTKLIFALKTEQNFASKSNPNERLKIETTVLQACNKIPEPERRQHFIKLIDKGVTARFKFIVMEMVGPSIDDIKKHFICGEFSKSTAAKLSNQALQGLFDLHCIGFLHRDVKPQNFCIGLNDKEDMLYILDFGIARQYTNRNGMDVRAARSYVKFLGTVRYASRTCHRAKEQSRKDDMETWIYMTVEMFDSGNIFWKKNVDRVAVLMEKEKFFSFQFPQVWNKTPACFKEVMQMVDKLQYAEEPNYPGIKAILEKGYREANIDLTQPFEWLGKLKNGLQKKTTTTVAPEPDEEDLEDDKPDKPVPKVRASQFSKADRTRQSKADD
uniref:Protein kinase domain-containing protein n=1 Tax=Panagrolaimus sp. JU765 TaxID=591449 RepID=A0AC34R239_9BILA